jgi:hypothetical protein
MALTYRQTKGSALTIQELDANFQYFTGSHAVTGSQIISGSLEITGSLSISGSSINLPTFVLNEYSGNAAAAAAGIPIGGLYRNGSFIQIRYQ